MEHTKDNHQDEFNGMEVAVIGMECRFPGSRNLEQFWDNLENGRECLTHFTEEELLKEGISLDTLRDPSYVKARGIVEDVEYFDAAFFGYTPSEAQVMHPQMRFMHEVAWLALDDAGYPPNTYDGLIGVYTGGRSDFHWDLKMLFMPPDDAVDSMTAGILGSKDHLSMRISYMFNLRGPSYTFYTACSTSLVGIHLGIQAVLSGECDIALAGGVTIGLPQRSGYFYREGMIGSSDGHVHSFDARADGLVAGNGIGLVVLKNLEDALDDGDHIYAIIKASGINNDGNRKIGYTASSIKGQEALIKEVYKTAEVDTRNVVLVECHGSATPLGDPVEVEAMRRSFHQDKGDFCAIGSVKTNIGHCDCAAGVASFIKTVLTLKHRKIPANLSFETPNPKIDFANSPFYIPTKLVDLNERPYPIYASVNSLGLGGTNVHVVLREAPEPLDTKAHTPQRRYFILPFSAKTPTALDKMVKNLVEFLKENPQTNIADVAYTLQVARTPFPYRRAFVCSDTQDAIRILSDPDSAPIQPFRCGGEKERPIIFMFSGQGSEYINMGLDLYDQEPQFRKDIDEGFEYLTSLIGEDIRYVLYPKDEKERNASEPRIHRFYYTQPVKFIFEYAYSRLLMRWGFKPHAMIGYSFGEYIVSCLAGVFTMQDALKVLMKRGEILEKAPAGNMISVSLPESEVIPLLKPGLFIGGINTDNLCLVSGSAEVVDVFEKELEEKQVGFVRYRAACAGHSPLMDPILPELGDELEKITFNKPTIPFVSGLTGTWMTVQDATDPSYFTRQLREPVRFADALHALFDSPDAIFMEVGPGTTLANFVNFYKDSGQQPDILCLTMIRHHKDPVSDDFFLLNRTAQLWTYGRTIDWKTYYGKEKRRRLSLPGYPFEPQYYWVDIDPFKVAAKYVNASSNKRKTDVKDFFYVPSWKTKPLYLGSEGDAERENASAPWLIFTDNDDLGNTLASQLNKEGRRIITVHSSHSFEVGESMDYSIDPADASHFRMLLEDLNRKNMLPGTIIHLWNWMKRNSELALLEWNETIQDMGYHSLIYLAQAIGREMTTMPVQIEVVANGMQSIAGEFLEYPEKATLLGPIKNIPQEYPNIKCRLIDAQFVEPQTPQHDLLVRQLIDEFSTEQTSDQVIAYRRDRRFVQGFELAPLGTLPKTRGVFKENGVYLITGGLGGVGLSIAHYLYKHYKARLVLTTRYGLPPRETWNSYLSGNDPDEKMATRIRKIKELEDQGAEVMIPIVSVSDQAAMKETLEEVEKRFGPVNGILHSAFVPDGTLIDLRTKGITEEAWAPKVKGTLILHELFKDREPLDFFAICSSLAGVFGPVGQVAYTAASAFEDAFAYYRDYLTGPRTRNVSINWCGWGEIGGLIEFGKKMAEKIGEDPEKYYKDAMKPSEGVEAFTRILGSDAPQVLVYNFDLFPLLKHLNTQQTSLRFQESLADRVETLKTILKRPALKTQYVAPQDKNQESIARIWQDLFGLETVGIKDDFFELGGDSLKAMTVSSRIQKELHVKIPISLFFSSPTIEELSSYVDESGRKESRTAPVKAPQKDFYPATPDQEHLYKLHYLDPQTPNLNITSPIILPLKLDHEGLENAFQKMIERHDIYRTSFHTIDGKVMLKVHSQVDIHVEYYQCAETELKELLAGLITPFDLSQPPILRVKLIEIDDRRSVLMMDTHYIVTDGTSAGIFIRELVDTYFGKELSPLALGYKDYTQWNDNRITSGQFASSETFWKERLKESFKPLELPTDFPQPAVRTFNAGREWINVEKELVSGLKEAFSDINATMFMIWLAAYNILLQKLTKQEDIIMGIRTANRPFPELHGILGKFSNDLVFRSKPHPGKHFNDYLEEVKHIALDGFKHQDYPFNLLMDRIGYDDQSGRKPFFSTLMVYNNNNMDVENVNHDDIRISYYHTHHARTLTDIHFQATELGETINILFQYSSDLFKPETIKRMIRQYVNILETISKNPRIPISDISI